MTKFDNYLSQLVETNNISPNVVQPNTQVKPGTTPQPTSAPGTTPQPNQTTPSPTPVPSTQTNPSQQNKFELEKFIKDFNDNKITIQGPKDLEKYGFQVK